MEPSREIVGPTQVPFLRILRLGLLLGPKLSLKPILSTILVAADMAAAFLSVSPGSHSAEGPVPDRHSAPRPGSCLTLRASAFQLLQKLVVETEKLRRS